MSDKAGDRIRFLIDAELEQTQDPFRGHLGASTVGGKCMREVWFKFRWAKRVTFEGRMLRLFNRGHITEPRMVEWLRGVGCEIWTHDDQGNQFRIKEHGHYGGSCDGVGRKIPTLPPDLPALLEIKTHNDKWFKELKKKGVKEGFPKHYKQAQAYMRGLNLTKCLYCAINKNDDDLYFEIFDADPTVGQHLSIRAQSIIYGTTLPPRIAETPAWYECKFCDFRPVCFEFEMPHVNCRTCINSKPEPDGTWSCAKGQPQIKDSPEAPGCDYHLFTPLLFPSATVETLCFDENWITYQTKKGTRVTNGLNHTTSPCLDMTC